MGAPGAGFLWKHLREFRHGEAIQDITIASLFSKLSGRICPVCVRGQAGSLSSMADINCGGGKDG